MEESGLLMVLLAIGVLLVGAVFLRLAVQIVTRSVLPFGRACFVVFIDQLAISAAYYALHRNSRYSAAGPGAGELVMFITYFLLAAGIHSLLIRHPTTGDPIGAMRGILVTGLLAIVPVVVIGVAFGMLKFF